MALFSAGCSGVSAPRFSIPKVHKIDIQQGNVITQEVIEKLEPGMNKNQVRQLLGTPMIEDPFHRDRWDYLYTLKPGRGSVERRQITLRFDQDQLARLEGGVVARVGPLPERDLGSQTVIVPPAGPDDALVPALLRKLGLGKEAAETPEHLAALPAPTGEEAATEQSSPAPAGDDWGLFDGLLKE
ncbi:MAG: outer membrane protein assembly factor BamE [Gammaproteobacteria bacterium]|nr:outer membrane protein assembly factor BamE [Gammaproteobacteria bacterium]